MMPHLANLGVSIDPQLSFSNHMTSRGHPEGHSTVSAISNESRYVGRCSSSNLN